MASIHKNVEGTKATFLNLEGVANCVFFQQNTKKAFSNENAKKYISKSQREEKANAHSPSLTLLNLRANEYDGKEPSHTFESKIPITDLEKANTSSKPLLIIQITATMMKK